MYVVSKLKEMPKLHRAVWRGDLMKVKSIGNGIRKTVLNTRDHKYRLACFYETTMIINNYCPLLEQLCTLLVQKGKMR